MWIERYEWVAAQGFYVSLLIRLLRDCSLAENAAGTSEEPQEPSVRVVEAGSRRKPIRAAVIVVGIAALLLFVFLLVFFVTMPQLVPDRWGPNVDMVAHPTNEGFDIIITIDREEPLSRFELRVLKDGHFWSSSPTPLSDGNILNGPYDEYLNFTDLTGDGRLSNGDFFTLENLSSGSQYEVVLVWALTNHCMATELVKAP